MNPKKRPRTKYFIIIGIAFMILLATTFSNEIWAAFGALKGVKTVEPKDLQALTTEQDALLIDVRERREFEISHLKNAVWVGDIKTKKLDKNRVIVLYCTIGYRSTELGMTLSKQDFHNIYNLDGGIFRWKNEKRTVFNQKNQPTDSVHIYSDMFRYLLKEGVAVE